MNTNKPKRPVFLYIVIAVLVLALAALGTLTFFSVNRLAELQTKVNDLIHTVEDIFNSSSALVQKSQQLDALYQTPGDETTSENSTNAQEEAAPSEEGMLSPSKGNFSGGTDMENLLSQVQNLLPQNNGTWSVYIANLSAPGEGAINDTAMQAASLIKLYIMGAVYENYETLASQYGTETLDANLNAMITVSDNDAANALVACLGGGDSAAGMSAVNQFCQAHGFSNTSMGRLLLAPNDTGDNYTSVGDCGKFLKAVYYLANGGVSEIQLSHADAMYNLLKMQQRTNKIPAQIPEGVGIANKTGELTDVENDAGILYNTAKGMDLVICFMSENLTDAGAAQNSIAQNSRMIYGYFNE